MKRWMLTVAVIVFVAPLLVGCWGGGYYEARLPVLERPNRPILYDIPASEMQKMSPEARKSVVANFDSLIGYTQKLEIAVDGYNKFAAERNKQYGEK
jgi:hypothetical protein